MTACPDEPYVPAHALRLSTNAGCGSWLRLRQSSPHNKFSCRMSGRRWQQLQRGRGCRNRQQQQPQGKQQQPTDRPPCKPASASTKHFMLGKIACCHGADCGTLRSTPSSSLLAGSHSSKLSVLPQSQPRASPSKSSWHTCTLQLPTWARQLACLRHSSSCDTWRPHWMQQTGSTQHEWPACLASYR